MISYGSDARKVQEEGQEEGKEGKEAQEGGLLDAARYREVTTWVSSLYQNQGVSCVPKKKKLKKSKGKSY